MQNGQELLCGGSSSQIDIDDDDFVVDYDELLTRCMNNVELAERVLERFEQSFAEDLTLLERLQDQRSAAQMRVLAHRLKGTTANVAAHRMNAILINVESKSAAGDAEIAAELVQLRRQWRRLQNRSPRSLVDGATASTEI